MNRVVHIPAETSKIALEDLDVSRLQSLVYETIRDAGPAGIHSDEVRRRLPDLAYSSVTARYRALLDKGLLWLPGTTRKGDSGRAQRVMVADVWGRL